MTYKNGTAQFVVYTLMEAPRRLSNLHSLHCKQGGYAQLDEGNERLDTTTSSALRNKDTSPSFFPIAQTASGLVWLS